MKLAGFLLLLAGWAIVIFAVALLASKSMSLIAVLGIDHDVLRLQVAVHLAKAMRTARSTGNLRCSLRTCRCRRPSVTVMTSSSYSCDPAASNSTASSG